MNKYFFLVAALALTCFASCRMNVLKGEGNKTTATPAVESFNAVEIDIALKATINVQPGAQPSVQINGYENLLKHIKTKVENGTLRIYSDLDETWRMESSDVTAQVTLPTITALTLNGAPDADVTGAITGSSFKLEISGASDVKIASVNTDNFAASLSGAGDIQINGGTVKTADLEINGAGDIKALQLQANEAEATVNGSGDIDITAVQKLKANINGAGSIKYKGHPTVSQEVAGAGTVAEAQ